MTITFRCEHCHKDVKAPDEAAGKRGKCPYCGHSAYIPAPVSEEDLIPIAEDEDFERQRERETARLFEAEKALLSEMGASEPDVPLEHREDVKPEDLHHFVVNFCLDMAASNLPRAQIHADKLKKFPHMARQAIDDFVSGKVLEPALDRIPPRVLRGFLTQLRDQVKPL